MMEMEQALRKLLDPKGLRRGELMKNHTTFQIGGPADFFWEATDEKKLADVIKLGNAMGFPMEIIGNGSNLLVSDAGISGLVIKIGEKMGAVQVHDNCMTVQAGVRLKTLCQSALKHSLSGLEFAYGIPGTLGGALTMNAGAYGGEMSHILEFCRLITREGSIRTVTLDEMQMDYRSSRIHETKEIIVEAQIRLSSGSHEEIQALMTDYHQRRSSRQPYHEPSAGSVFKRPPGHFAGQLIETCQLKGVTVGGAKISEQHAGFIVNIGDATAGDVRQLMEMIISRVKEVHGVVLEPEVRFLGI